MTTIGTNLAAMRAANAGYAASRMQSTAMERLSTGKQINSAKDNAAGLAISTSMTAQIQGMGQGIRNANDGVSLAQTAEGVLTEVTNMLQRIREVATQAANGTYSAADQKLIQLEVAQLTDQIGEITASSQFNGVKLFETGSTPPAGFTIQVGPNAGDVIELKKPHLDAASITTEPFAGMKVDVDMERDTLASQLGYLKGAAGATAEALRNTGIGTPAYAIVKDAAYKAAGDYLTRVRNGVELTEAQSETLMSINELKITADESAREFAATSRTDPNYAYLGSVAHAASNTYLSAVGRFQDGVPVELSTVPGDLFGRQGAADAMATTQTAVRAANIEHTGLNLATEAAASAYSTASAENGRANSTRTLGNVDALLQKVTMARSELGAGQSRLESAISNLTTSTINLSDARSRIEDTDYSAETTALAKAQILSQASSAMLAQANQSQENVMSLLRQ